MQENRSVVDMENSLFRKKSLERISSPEQLNDYIKVSNPSVWLVIGAMIIIAVSFSIWAFNGNITSEISGTGVFKTNNKNNIDLVVCYVDANYASKISEGMPVRIYDKFKPMNAYINGKVTKISQTPVNQEDILHSYSSEYIADNLLESDYGVEVLVKLNKNLQNNYDWANNEIGNDDFIKLDGLCKVDIITESITPINFLFNGSKSK